MTEQSTVLDTPFDTEKEEGTKFDLIPPGKHTAEIEDAKVVVTKNGNGQMVKLRWKIIEGDYDGRVVFQQIVIQHTSAEAQRIGRMKFKDIAAACDIKERITDLEVLKYKPCTIDIGIEKDETGNYGDQNRVRYVKPYVENWNGGERAMAKPAKSNGGDGSPAPNDALPF
jgi:hypothetical protein